MLGRKVPADPSANSQAVDDSEAMTDGDRTTVEPGSQLTIFLLHLSVPGSKKPVGRTSIGYKLQWLIIVLPCFTPWKLPSWIILGYTSLLDKPKTHDFFGLAVAPAA